MIKKEDINLTMLSIPYVKSKHLDDKQSRKIIEKFENAKDYQIDCDAVYDGFLTRNVIARHAYLSEKINKYKHSFEQLLILSVGLDTKPDTLPALKDKNCFGLDIAANDIKNIYTYSQTQTKTKILQCDFQKDIHSALLDKLEHAGMIRSKPTYIIWEGGTFYIDASDIYHTLQYLCHHLNIIGCSIDFMNKDLFSPPRHQKAKKQLQLVEKIGVPWKSFFSKEALEKMFKKLGFTDIAITLHGEYEKKALGNINLDEDIMYMATAVRKEI